MDYNSSDVVAGVDDITAEHYNDARKDALKQFDFELGENLNVNSLVRLIDDSGEKIVSLIEAGDFDITNIGTPQVVESVASSDNYVSCCGIGTNKILIIYSTSSDTKIVVGTVDGTLITFGLAVQFSSSVLSQKKSVKVDSDKAIIFYKDSSDSDKGKAVIINVSGTVPTIETPATFETGSISDIGAEEIDANKFCAAYRVSDNDIWSIIATVSSNTVLFGTGVELDTDTGNSSSFRISVCKINTDKAFIIYSESGSSSRGTAVAASISGTTISSGTPLNFTTTIAKYTSCAGIGIDKAFITYADSVNDGKSVVATISGTTITFGSIYTFDSNTISGCSCIAGSSDDEVLIVYEDQTEGKSEIISGTVSGTTITFETEQEIESIDPEGVLSIAFISSDKYVSSYRIFSPTGVRSVIIEASGDTINADNYFGILKESGLDGEIKKVTILNGIDDNQSGMTPVAIQYIDNDGTLTEIDQGNGAAGRALSATEILLTKNP